MKRTYIVPKIGIQTVHTEQSLLLRFSQVDNDGDGKTDQRPIIEGDPEGGIGAKPGWFEDDSNSGTKDFNSWGD